MNIIVNSKLKSCLITLLLIITGCAGATAATTMNPVVKQVKTTVEKEKLVSDPSCTDYLFTKDAEKGMDLVDVMEKHGGKCIGDPQVQHRLFSVYVDQKTKQMLSDRDDPEDGNLSLLQPAG
ncbi:MULTISPECIES: hypothetical protein [unclassified Erwinia]|uniref:hypothetical protein n=1 Tax=unclassified Erwinia TaxID=2622719 RepID=UPI0009ECF3EB|nr:hypothetical protein [Erwinia sp. ErVv1]